MNAIVPISVVPLESVAFFVDAKRPRGQELERTRKWANLPFGAHHAAFLAVNLPRLGCFDDAFPREIPPTAAIVC